MRTVTISETGRIALPADLRRELGIEGAMGLEVEVGRDQDAPILRPAVVMRRSDAWVYTPEHREWLRRCA